MKLLNLVYTLTALISIVGCASPAHADSFYETCAQDTSRRETRSRELQEIVKADQADRVDWQKKTSDQLAAVVKRDEIRRKRVGEIFGEGCFSTADDYAAAALVYQHGTTPDHFYQTFIWSKRGVDLGDKKQEQLMALGLDRYLVNIGHKQLFASQFTRPGADPGACWCLQQVEHSYPDATRKAFAGRSLDEDLDFLKDLNKGLSCPVAECKEELAPSPKGTVPGFW